MLAHEKTSRPSICLVPSDLNYLYRNGGIGSYFWQMAHLLAERKWRVHILYGGPVDDRQALAEMPKRLGSQGIQFSHLDDIQPPAAHQVSPFRPAWYAQISDRVRHALEGLHRVHHFDLIEFGDLNCYGFRSVQAKRTGGAFRGARLMVKLHGTSQWLREGNYLPMQQADDLRLDYCERYAFEHADIQLSPCQYMLDYVRGTGWNVRAEARVVPYAFPPARFAARSPRGDLPLEVVFFGRLETRKGLEIFVDAARQLAPRTPITFLGRDTVLGSEVAASQWIRSRLEGRPIKLLTELNQQQALTYLLEGNRLAVISSLADNFPNTVIECAVNGIAFIASRVGGIPEILWDPMLQDELLFEPTTPDLLRCLKEYLRAPASRRQELRDQARRVSDVDSNHERVAEAYQELAAEASTPTTFSAERATIAPRVSVLVTHCNQGCSLPEALGALAAETYPNLEVLVIDDGSTCPSSLRVFSEQQAFYPQFRFLSQANAGPGAARSRGLALATGEYVITLDAGSVCLPQTVQRLVEALGACPELSALGCYVVGVKEAADIADTKFASAFRPTGGPAVLASLENVYGDVAILRAEELRSVGGFDTNREAGAEPWDVFVKLAAAGRGVDALPEYLCFCIGRDPAVPAPQSRTSRRNLAPFVGSQALPSAEQMGLLELLISTHRRYEERGRELAQLQTAHQHVSDQLGQLSRGNQVLGVQVHGLRVHAENLQHHLAAYQEHIAHLQQANDNLSGRLSAARYRVADKLNGQIKRVPLIQRTVKGSLYMTWTAWKGMKSAQRLGPSGIVRKVLARLRNRQNAA
jgi:glycosyltransferase involved in cell wall biosynthesis